MQRFICVFVFLLACGGEVDPDSGNNQNNGNNLNNAQNNANNINNQNNGNNVNNESDGGFGEPDMPGSRDMGIVNRDNWYPGIPYPTDRLPSGIMPTLPTPNAADGWPYDPLTIENPTPTGGANEFVVAVDGNDGNAGNQGNGTVDSPRRTIPTGNHGPGTKIFIYGQNSPYGEVDFDFGETSFQFDCVQDDPCFVVGIDSPRVGYRATISNSQHLILDGLSFVDTPQANRAWGRLSVTDSQYIVTRNMEIRGDGSNTRGGSAFSMSNVQYLVSFRMTIHEIGSWNSNAQDLDVHGWRPTYGNRYLWLIDSDLFHLQADGIQVGNSSNPNPQSESSHYVFIAGNRFSECYENALDNKNGYHVIFSSNEVHDFYAAPDGSGANGTAIILSNNSEGPWTGYHWAINNKIWNTSLAIRDSGSEDDEKNYAVGNVIWNAGTAFVQANNAANREFWVVHNTAYEPNTAIDVFQPGNNSSLYVRNNIFVGGSFDTQSQVTSDLSNNVLFGSNVGGNWDVETDNLSDDPLLADPENGDMTLGNGSPALENAPEDPVFALFESLYGVSIRTDLNGVERVGNANIGATE